MIVPWHAHWRGLPKQAASAVYLRMVACMHLKLFFTMPKGVVFSVVFRAYQNRLFLLVISAAQHVMVSAMVSSWQCREKKNYWRPCSELGKNGTRLAVCLFEGLVHIWFHSRASFVDFMPINTPIRFSNLLVA